MLSLFEKNNIKMPDILPKFKKLYIDKIQSPLALTPTTEDDTVILYYIKLNYIVGTSICYANNL